jgi:hypothetical protein
MHPAKQRTTGNLLLGADSTPLAYAGYIVQVTCTGRAAAGPGRVRVLLESATQPLSGSRFLHVCFAIVTALLSALGNPPIFLQKQARRIL